jgi:hypothetical protein
MPGIYDGARLAVGLGDIARRPVSSSEQLQKITSRLDRHWKNEGCSWDVSKDGLVVDSIVISTDCTKCPLDMCRYDTNIYVTWKDMVKKGLVPQSSTSNLKGPSGRIPRLDTNPEFVARFAMILPQILAHKMYKVQAARELGISLKALRKYIAEAKAGMAS